MLIHPFVEQILVQDGPTTELLWRLQSEQSWSGLCLWGACNQTVEDEGEWRHMSVIIDGNKCYGGK